MSEEKIFHTEGIRIVRKNISTSPVQRVASTSSPVVEERKNIERRKFPTFFVLSIVLVGIFAGLFFWINPFSKQSESMQEVLTEVGKLVVLPEGEEPSMATVTSLEPLEGQDFFDNAQIGDKVLIFSVSKKAILYRPSEKKIIEIAPINPNKP